MRTLQVTTAQSAAGSTLVGGPIKLRGWSLNDGTATQELQNTGSVAAPAANANIVTLSLSNGVYQVSWVFELTGTVSASDVDNVKLLLGSTRIDTSDNPGTVGDYGPFITTCVVTGGPQTLKAAAVGAATVGSTYTVKLTVTPIGNTLATISDGSMPIATAVMSQGASSNFDISEPGWPIDSALSVQSAQGNVSGNVFYTMPTDEKLHPGETL